ncbi:MAG TPA: glycosyltransferase family 39 protein [Chloroflexia bacterium]
MITDTPSRPAQADSLLATNGHITYTAPSRREAPKPHTSPTPTYTPGRKWLLAIIYAYVGLCTLYTLLTPIGEGPDEYHHIRYVEYLVRYGQLPPIRTGDSTPPYTLEAKQPPTYYLLNAGIMLALGRSGKLLVPDLTHRPYGGQYLDPPATMYPHAPVPADLLPWTYIMRATGMLFGICTILLTFATVRQVFPRQEESPLAVGAAALVGLLPQFTFISSVVNNDNLAILIGVATSYVMVRILMHGANWRRAASLGVMLGLVLLGKSNLLIFIPAGLLVLCLPGLPLRSLRGNPRNWGRPNLAYIKHRLPLLALSLVICALVGGWWTFRNISTYGDPLGHNAVNQMASEIALNPVVAVPVTDSADIGMHVRQLVFTSRTHFGWFGWEAVEAPALLYGLYFALISLSIIGLLLDFKRRTINGRQAACLLLGALIFELGYVAMTYNAAWRGRLIFPALALTSLLVVRGTYSWLNLLSKGRLGYAPTAAMLAAFLGLSNVYCLFALLVPAYYGGS